MRHQFLIGSVIWLGACVDASPSLPLGQTDGGPPVRLDAATTPDADVERSYPITVYDTSGQRAPSALVYQLSDSQGRLLGRADADGVFFVNSPARVLVRRGFDQVEIRQLTRDENVDVYLASIEERPQTQELFGVGLESLIFRGPIFRALTYGQWVVAAQTEVTPEGLMGTSVHINAATGAVRRLPLPTRPLTNADVFESTLLAVDQNTAAIVLMGGRQPGVWSGSVTFLEIRTGSMISSYNFEDALNPKPVTDNKGEFALLSTTPSGQLHVDHFAVNTPQGIRRSQVDFVYSAGDALGLGLRNGVAYFEDSPNVVAADVLSMSTSPAISGLLGPTGCGLSCWFGPTGIHHLQIDNTGDLIYAGDGQSTPHSFGDFDSNALVIHPKDDVALVVGQRARPDKFAFVNTRTASSIDVPITEYLEQVRLASDGPNYAVFAQNVGPVYYTLQSDGSNLRRVEVPAPDGLECIFPEMGVSDVETKRRWLACGTGEPEQRHLFEADTGVQRNFFSSAQYTQHAQGGPWLYFYDFSETNQVGLHVINTEALR